MSLENTKSYIPQSFSPFHLDCGHRIGGKFIFPVEVDLAKAKGVIEEDCDVKCYTIKDKSVE